MSFTIENVEFYILIIVRISTFVFSAPFFNISNVPLRLKIGFSLFLTLIMFQLIGYQPLHYSGNIGFASLVIKEAVVGLLIGYMTNICSYIINFTGQIIDMEIGFSMVNIFDPVSKIQTTITGNFYSYMVMLMLLATNMHYFILNAIVDSFQLIPIGDAFFSPNLYEIMVRFLGDYFIIGFRITLPVFGAILLVNVILGIIAKIAPQMNMFVVGIQLKVFVGLFILLLIVGTIPTISRFIFEEMEEMASLIIKAIVP